MPAEREIRAITEQCVMCGLCLPHCPSYRVAQQEAESPRGRIALMARIAAGELGGASQPTLDTCLACGSCEHACPAGVPFVRALMLTRATHARAAESTLGGVGRQLARRRRLSRWLLRPLVAARLLLPRPWRRRMNLDGLAQMECPGCSAPAPTASGSGNECLILAGCAGDSMESRALAALGQIADRLQLPLRIEQQSCCGALDSHLGRPRPACLPDLSVGQPVVAINSGCTAQWRNQLAPHHVTPIAQWLQHRLAAAAPSLRSRTARVAVHVPCSQRGIQGEALALRQLLDMLPGIECVALPGQPTCCGAAGTYFLNQPEISQRLADEMACAIVGLGVDIVVSSNGGCRAQIGQALHEIGSQVRVLHPAELVALHLEPRD
ncbi:MAG: (Fe-S)-binding protein [Xanthomonadales bacterium]|nr:(Fe-S)-binding protein [Xanthomonadales bacterium]